MITSKNNILILLALCFRASCFATVPTDSLIGERINSTKAGDWAVVMLDQIPLLWVVEPYQQWLSWFEWELPDQLVDADVETLEQWLRSAQALRAANIYALNSNNLDMIYWDAAEHSWLMMDSTQALIGNLLSLPLQSLADKDQRRIGPRPRIDQEDNRPLWRPPMSRKTVKTCVWRGFWIDDGSPLANAEIVIYNSTKDDAAWPPIMPTHVYAERVGLRWSLKVLNGGRGLNLPQPYKQLLSELSDAAVLLNEKDPNDRYN